MDKRLEKPLLIVSTVFGITTTVGQVVSIEHTAIKVAVLLPNMVVWTYFIWVFSTIKKPLPANATLSSMASKLETPEITFRHLRTDTELQQIWLIDNQIYGEQNISREALSDWYSKFRKGTYAMYNGVHFLGYVGIYPLQRESFKRLKEGVLKEERISSSDLCSEMEATACTTWYFSGFALERRNLFEQMASAALYNWASWFREDQVIEAVSFAYEGPDANFLKVIGFYEVLKAKAKYELPVVYRNFTKTEILSLAKKWASTNAEFVSHIKDR